MLRQLHISDLGVIEDVDLELSPGLNVVTGETGAGKTMLTVGLALALGMRASSALVREGAEAARVQARFDAPGGEEIADLVEEGELLLARTVAADGRGSARIGGQLAPVSALARLAPLLVEVEGQNRAQRLLTPAAQTAFLDRFAGDEHLETVEAYREAHDELRRARVRLEELEAGEREREREVDLLTYQVREIEAARVLPGELAELVAEERRLEHAERLLERASATSELLGSESGGGDALRSAAAALAEVADLDTSAAELAARAAGLAEESAELARDVRDYAERVQLDPGRLEEVRERLQLLRGLERKYGEGADGIRAYLREASERLRAIGGAGEERIALRARVEEMQASVRELASRVSAGRTRATPGLAEAVRAELRDLGMQGADLEIRIHDLSELGPWGAERPEAWFSGGSGQVPMPLAKVASGGELSRTMLACRSVLADLDEVPTLVFDEVDTGIGGRAGVAVGRRLARLARSRQVLVVTHLPQIASFADRHIRVDKAAGVATIEVLEGERRVEELSRMLSGLPGSATAADHAEELLVEADRAKADRSGASAR